MSNLHNKVAVVTGAGHPKGIGRAIVERLKASGARVLAVDLAMIDKSGIDVMTCDITNADDISALTDSVTKQFGRVDILVNNAGWVWAQRNFNSARAMIGRPHLMSTSWARSGFARRYYRYFPRLAEASLTLLR